MFKPELSKAQLDMEALKMRSIHFASEYFNPYLSVGLGTDRLLAMPEVGLKISRLRAQAGYYTNFGSQESMNLVGEINVLKLKSRSGLTPYVSVGVIHTTRRSEVFYHTVYQDSKGGLIGMNFTKEGTRSNFGLRLGYQKSEFEKHNRDFDQVDIGTEIYYGEGIIIGLSYNLYLFSF